MSVAVQVERLSVLIHLEARARAAASAAELGFVMVNETTGLVGFRQAALWIAGRGIQALSGVPQVEANAPFVLWLDRLCRGLAARGTAGPVDHSLLDPADSAEWHDWLPLSAAWVPLEGQGGTGGQGGLLVARDEFFSDADLGLLGHVAGAYGHAWAALHRPTTIERLKARLAAMPRRRVRLMAAAAVALLLVPVRLSVLAPAEMVPADPALVRAPMDGVVETIHVRPNDAVTEGQALFDLDSTTVLSRLEVADKALAGAEAEYRQAIQQAVWDPKAKAQLAIIGGRIEERRADADYLRGLLDRTQVRAPRAGIVVVDDPSAWLGRPVALGEKVMAVTGETDTEVEAWLAIGDAIPLQAGAPVTAFLDVAPLSPIDASLRILGYEAQPRPDGTLGYRLRATIATGEDKPRVGLRGTARIDGERVPLVYWLFRKPLATVRQWLGV